MKTTKSDLIESISIEHDVSVKEAQFIVESILKLMTEALGRGENIELRGFGTFKIKQYAPYIGKNPRTGESVTVKSKKLPVFKPGKQLQRAVNNTRKA